MDVSLLTELHPISGLLRQASISDYATLAGFDELETLLRGLRFPTPQGNKFETFGWVPTLYVHTPQTFKKRGGGTYTKLCHWRCSEGEADHLSAFYMDVDNADKAQPHQSMDDVCDRIEAAGIRYFAYSSFSHSDTCNKFRLVMPASRTMTREEMFAMFLWLNWEYCGGQGDPSIYDPADFIYAPPHNTIFRRGGAADLAVDDVLSYAAMLADEHPEILTRIDGRVDSARTPRKRRIVSPTEAKRLDALRRDPTVRRLVTIRNSDFWNPTWDRDYRNAASHWQSMRSLLGRVWCKAKASLTYGEMIKIFDEIDATDGSYFLTKYSEERRDDLVDYVMAQGGPEPPCRLHHRNISDSSLVPSEWISGFLNDPNDDALEQFIASIDDRARVHGYSMSDDAWLTLIADLTKLKMPKG